MLINLNSINESNPSNFRNTFSQSIEIKPDSYVCLTGAMFTKLNHLKRIFFATASKFVVRLLPYDIIEIPIPAGEYSPSTLIELYNAAFPNNTTPNTVGSKNLIMSSNSIDIPIDGEDSIYFEFINKGASQAVGQELVLLGYNDNYSQYKSTQVGAIPEATLRPNNADKITSVIGGDTALYATAPQIITTTSSLNPLGYTIPSNQENGNALNLACSFVDGASPFFMIGQPNLTGVKFLLGQSQYSVVDSKYTTAATFGGTQWTNPSVDINNCPFYISFKNTGKCDIYGLNTNTGAFVAWATDQGYEPGDVFSLSFTDLRISTVIPPGYANEIVIVSHYQSNGLGILDLFNFAGVTKSWNTSLQVAINLNQPMNLFQADLSNVTRWRTYWDAVPEYQNNTFGVRAGTGVFGENYIDANNGNRFPWTQVGIGGAIDKQTGNVKSWLDNRPLFQRYTTAAAPSTNVDLRSALTYSTDGIKCDNFPFMFSFYTLLVDDTAKIPGGNNDAHNFLNDINGERMFVLHPSQAEAYDATIRFSDGTELTMILNDPTPTRINITYGVNYYVRLCYTGTTISNYIVSVYDLDNNIKYEATINTAKKLEDFSSLSNNDTNAISLINYAKCFNGYMGDFRFHSASQNASVTNVHWDNIYQENADYLRTGADTDQTLNYWGGWRYAPITPPDDTNYTNIGLINPGKTLTPVFHKDTLDINVKDTNWGDFVAPFFRHATYTKNDIRVVTGLDAEDTRGDEIGLINVPLLDPDGVDDISFPNEDANGNVLENIFDLTRDTTVSNPTIGEVIYANIADTDTKHENINIEIPNLPHRSYNGVTRTQDKTIYTVPPQGVNSNELVLTHEKKIACTPPTKIWIPLNNPGSLTLNELQVKLTDVFGKELGSALITQETNVQLEIKSRNDIF